MNCREFAGFVLGVAAVVVVAGFGWLLGTVLAHEIAWEVGS